MFSYSLVAVGVWSVIMKLYPVTDIARMSGWPYSYILAKHCIVSTLASCVIYPNSTGSTANYMPHFLQGNLWVTKSLWATFTIGLWMKDNLENDNKLICKKKNPVQKVTIIVYSCTPGMSPALHCMSLQDDLYTQLSFVATYWSSLQLHHLRTMCTSVHCSGENSKDETLQGIKRNAQSGENEFVVNGSLSMQQEYCYINMLMAWRPHAVVGSQALLVGPSQAVVEFCVKSSFITVVTPRYGYVDYVLW